MDDENSEYLNFNYTYTLEKLYNIKKVNHIHIEDKVGRDYIFGHKKKYKKKSGFFKNINSIFNNAEVFAKPVNDYIKRGKVRYENIAKIYFWGFSLSEVDKPYIEQILKDNRKTIENVYLCSYQYNNNFEKSKFQRFLNDNQIDNDIKEFNDEIKKKI